MKGWLLRSSGQLHTRKLFSNLKNIPLAILGSEDRIRANNLWSDYWRSHRLISRQDISVWSSVLTVWVDKNDHPPFFHWIFDSLGPRILHRKPYKTQQNLKTAFFVFWHEWNWFSWDSEADCDWLINNEKGSKIGFVFILSLYSKPTKSRLIRLKYLSLENRTLRNRLWKSPILGVRIVRNDSE